MFSLKHGVVVVVVKSGMVCRTSSFCWAYPDLMTPFSDIQPIKSNIIRSHGQTVEPRHKKMSSGFLISSETGQDMQTQLMSGGLIYNALC